MLGKNACLSRGGSTRLWLSGTRACRKLGPLTYYRIQGCSEAIEDMASMHHKWLGSAPRQHPWRPQPQSPNVPTLPSSAREMGYSEELGASRKEESPWPVCILAVARNVGDMTFCKATAPFTGHCVGV